MFDQLLSPFDPQRDPIFEADHFCPNTQPLRMLTEILQRGARVVKILRNFEIDSPGGPQISLFIP